jgi:hypothetical protein
MKKVLFIVVTLLMSQSLVADDLQNTIDDQAMQIKQLKRALSLKEQELKILLITLKNSKQESMLHSNEQHLEFSDVDNVSATRVVVKPSMLSETAIKAIDHAEDVDTAALDGEISEDDASATPDETADVEVAATEDTMVVEDKITIKQEAEPKVIPKLSYMKPSTFALTMDADVFKVIFSKDGEAWKKGKRFTSNKKRGDWIQITGEITNGKWKQVSGELWIDQNCVKKVR